MQQVQEIALARVPGQIVHVDMESKFLQNREEF